VDQEEKQINADLVWLNTTADLLDNRFRIPGTKIRFGIDALVGLIPYAGDVISFFVATILVTVMYRKGASGKLVFKMIGNIWIDGVLGTIPLLGDIFDVGFRANRKNVDLMIEHYDAGKHRGSAWPFILLIIFIALVLVGISVYILLTSLSRIVAFLI
jgi:hypothetical protein